MMVCGLFKRIAPLAKSFWQDTQGIILPYVTIMLVVIVGVAVLALDGVRYMSLQTQLQNGADALALAGAAELDRMPDAENRSLRAINNLVVNSTLLGTVSSQNVQVAQANFYSRLPASDSNPMSAGIPATDATNARFISVTVKPTTLNTFLPASFFGGAIVVTTGASAVAGLDQVVCHATPLYVCNPYETQGMSYAQATAALQDAVATPSIRRRLIRLRQYGANSRPMTAGDMGFLRASTLGAGQGELVNALASARPAACFVQNGVSFRPGLIPAAREAFNVRFDIYEGTMLAHKNDFNYRPAENVRKGYVGGGGGGEGDESGNSCAALPGANWPLGSPPRQATGLPLDREWPYMDGRMGNGLWDFSTYWQANHGGSGRPPPIIGGAPASNENPPSRYSVYRYEIEQGYVNDLSPGGETGAPTCYSGNLSDKPDRRVIIAAIINCQSLGLRDDVERDVPVAAFGKFFLTLPAVSQVEFYVETVGLVKPGDEEDFDMVQLFR
jgi:hypothetical protein